MVWSCDRWACTLVTLMSGAVPPGLPPPVRVSVYCAVCSWVPAPFTVKVYAPGAAADVVDTVMTEVAPDCTEDGLKETLTPLGRPLADRFTVCALPELIVVRTVAVTELPGFTEPEAGSRDIEKSLFPLGAQVGSPLCAGTLTASQAAFARLNSTQVASRFLAAVSVAVR